MTLIEVIGAFIVALSIAYIYYKFVIFNFWRKRGVFYVEPIVPTGNITDVLTGKKHVGVVFHDAYLKYKNHRVIGMYTFFKPNLVLRDLDLIQIVLTKEFGSFHDRGIYCNEKIDPLSGHLVFMSGKKWRNLRIKLNPIFTSGKIKQMFPVLKECNEEFVKYLESKAQMKDIVDMKDMFARLSIDVIMSTAFGINSKCIEEPNNVYRSNARKLFVMKPIWIVLFLFAPQIMNFFSIPLTERDITNFYVNMFRENVKYRQTHNIVRYDFVNLLMELMEKGYVDPDTDKTSNTSTSMYKLSTLEAAAQSYAFFIGGFNTTSTTLTFALYELAQHHNIQDKLRKEIDELFAKHNELTYDNLNELTYLHQVISETLRKYPLVSVLNRVCTKEIILPTTNIHLPQDTVVTIPVLGLHRDPTLFPDPDKFDPERFNAEEVAKRHSYAFLPFGKGPRNCIGSRFAYMQMKVTLVNLLSKYKFNLHPRTRVPLVFSERVPILKAKGGVFFTIEPI